MPPRRKLRAVPSTTLDPTLAGQLRREASGSTLSGYALAKLAGLDSGALGRFLDGSRDLSLANAGKLAEALGLRLARPERKRGRPAGPRSQPNTPGGLPIDPSDESSDESD